MLLSSSRFEQEVLLEDVVIDSPSFAGAAASTPMEESVIRISFLCKTICDICSSELGPDHSRLVEKVEEWKGQGFPDLILSISPQSVSGK